MTPEQQRIAIAEACGYVKRSGVISYDGSHITWTVWDKEGKTYNHIPDYPNDLNAMHEAEKSAGLHAQANREIRVKWVNTLRKIVAPGCPKNKIGVPIVSDVDLLNATAVQRAEAFLRALNLWTS